MPQWFINIEWTVAMQYTRGQPRSAGLRDWEDSSQSITVVWKAIKEGTALNSCLIDHLDTSHPFCSCVAYSSSSSSEHVPWLGWSLHMKTWVSFTLQAQNSLLAGTKICRGKNRVNFTGARVHVQFEGHHILNQYLIISQNSAFAIHSAQLMYFLDFGSFTCKPCAQMPPVTFLTVTSPWLPLNVSNMAMPSERLYSLTLPMSFCMLGQSVHSTPRGNATTKHVH